MYIKPIATTHDIPSSGFLIDDFGFFTDTGTITNEMTEALKRCKGVLIESNHDIDMLLNGSYPHFLKQRILSDCGHLSNIHASEFINQAKRLRWVLLGHLSANNNTPELAQQTFEAIVRKRVQYSVLSRDKESGTWLL
jgi:phosphoribosyl 1,2-cyclic phosphodiesterase